ncbi:hypothetical protein CYK37_22495 [Mesorhizobium loti]|nr:hypothetical protein CYK37_22495 [Mesorhizobium loti]
MFAAGVVHDATASDADQQIILRGECLRLVVSGRDLTSGCEPILISSSPSVDNIQFQFAVKNRAILTIVGTDLPNPTDDTDQIKLVRYELNLGTQGVPPSGTEALGQCTFNNPFAGKMTLSCEGTAQDKPLSIVFVTDGRAPQQ